MKRKQISAFTLVELLVVVSIIALLVSILLPSLQRARDQAKTVKCMAHQGGLAKAALTYVSEENDWIPGSPGTSGSVILGQDWGAANVVDLPRAPVQTYDWAGPLAAVQLGMKNLPTNRVLRWKELISGPFECPSNRFIAEPWEGSDPSGVFPNQKLVSYNMMRNMLYWENGGDAPVIGDDSYDLTRGGIADGATLRPGFRPQLGQIGNPSEKVFISDGSRFVDESNPAAIRLDFDVNWAARHGGAFADGGPTGQDQYTRSFKQGEPEKFFAYRHRKGRKSGSQTQDKIDNTNGLVASHWDGHAEWLSAGKSRIPNRWWPKGSGIPLSALNNKVILGLLDSVGNDPSAFLALFPNNKYEIKR
ncbi:MAG: hypothetical protein DHS20C16_16500 [Phycisphaerae bacterium]|nr:MAG: hypothetical protein DHS20C16_16500 [Phycisphaerae bacterium]